MSTYTLPKAAFINKFLPKTKIFSNSNINYKTREKFASSIQRITWKYKLSENTIGVHKGSKAEEIQIFEIQLKDRVVPKDILSIITKAIPYPILFECIFNKDTAYAIKYDKEIFISDWNPDLQFEFNGVTLDKVYEKIISKFILGNNIGDGDVEFSDTMQRHKQVDTLKNDIEKLENKIKKEIQLNRKVPLNIELQKKKKELDKLLSHKDN